MQDFNFLDISNSQQEIPTLGGTVNGNGGGYDGKLGILHHYVDGFTCQGSSQSESVYIFFRAHPKKLATLMKLLGDKADSFSDASQHKTPQDRTGKNRREKESMLRSNPI